MSEIQDSMNNMMDELAGYIRADFGMAPGLQAALDKAVRAEEAPAAKPQEKKDGAAHAVVHPVREEGGKPRSGRRRYYRGKPKSRDGGQ